MGLCFVCVSFFFFKQKTAYEMRISDWSSDVCSSDLGEAVGDAADRIAHVVGGGLDVAVEGELQGHRGAAVAAARLQGLDAFDAGQRVLEHLGDAGDRKSVV